MDSFQANKLKKILLLIDDLGLEDETASHTSPPDQTKRRARKSHIPSVTTVPREERFSSVDRQALRNPSADQDGKKAPPYPP